MKITSNAKWSKIENSSDTHNNIEQAIHVCRSLGDYYETPCRIRGYCIETWVEIDGVRQTNGYESTRIKRAFEIIQQAMIDDNPSEPGSYAHSWHCNIAMMCQDAINSAKDTDTVRDIGNDAASRFMKLAFDVETKDD